MKAFFADWHHEKEQVRLIELLLRYGRQLGYFRTCMKDTKVRKAKGKRVNGNNYVTSRQSFHTNPYICVTVVKYVLKRIFDIFGLPLMKLKRL